MLKFSFSLNWKLASCLQCYYFRLNASYVYARLNYDSFTVKTVFQIAMGVLCEWLISQSEWVSERGECSANQSEWVGACDGQLPRARVDRGGLLRQGVQGPQEVLWTGQSLPIFILLFSDLEQVRPQWGHNNKAEVSLQIPGTTWQCACHQSSGLWWKGRYKNIQDQSKFLISRKKKSPFHFYCLT